MISKVLELKKKLENLPDTEKIGDTYSAQERELLCSIFVKNGHKLYIGQEWHNTFGPPNFYKKRAINYLIKPTDLVWHIDNFNQNVILKGGLLNSDQRVNSMKIFFKLYQENLEPKLYDFLINELKKPINDGLKINQIIVNIINDPNLSSELKTLMNKCRPNLEFTLFNPVAKMIYRESELPESKILEIRKGSSINQLYISNFRLDVYKDKELIYKLLNLDRFINGDIYDPNRLPSKSDLIGIRNRLNSSFMGEYKQAFEKLVLKADSANMDWILNKIRKEGEKEVQELNSKGKEVDILALMRKHSNVYREKLYDTSIIAKQHMNPESNPINNSGYLNSKIAEATSRNSN